ncbi:MAG: SEC-C domain-containing protein, partial [Planctomycetes bacterium]|nr:SEC-C domain-containing protein [Planctomycetota bacterium]
QFYRNDEMRQMLEEQFHQVFGESESGEVESLTISDATQKSVTELVTWAQRELKMEVSTEEALTWDRTEVRKRLEIALDARYRPEMCEMERVLLLQVLDGAWKDHLYGMDHLRQGIGLRGYAQIDPKVEYKREGMKEFARMWTRVADQVTGLVFRMEQADSGFVGSLWTISEAVHEEATAPTQAMNEQTEAAMKPADGQPKVETIRNRGERVGRNDPCPCGSGKKYKRCCLRQAG